MKTLISNTAFGVYIDAKVFLCQISIQEAYDARRRFDKFLSQPLTLSMFVPCDDEGNVLSEPKNLGSGRHVGKTHYLEVYNSAKEKVLFEGFEYVKKLEAYKQIQNYHRFKWNGVLCNIELDSKTVESMVKYYTEDFILTPTALKQIFG